MPHLGELEVAMGNNIVVVVAGCVCSAILAFSSLVTQYHNWRVRQIASRANQLMEEANRIAEQKSALMIGEGKNA